ncbi:50S ribosomal protein L1 [Candidatus Woesearchaeota archaeon]|nr:50S ribosomal protein L1 [Candidatus Woesearchaeota archaeon]
MNNKEIMAAIKAARENSKKRNFKQSFDLIINLKNVDIKKTDEQLDFFVPLHFSRGKDIKICALVGPELESDAKNVCDNSIPASDFQKYAKDKKLVKKLAEEYYFFIAQANIMPQVATTFGRVLGPRGKMPNPKAGCVVPPKGSLKPLYDRLQKTIKIVAKTDPIVHCVVGSEEMPDEEVMDNILTVYNQVIHHLPQEKNNIKSAYLKLTMGKSFALMGVKLEKEKKSEAPKEEKKDEVKEEKKPEEEVKEKKEETKKEKPKKESKPKKK